MKHLLSVVLVASLAVFVSGCGAAPTPVVPTPEGGYERLCPSQYMAFSYHHVRVINESRDECPVRVDILTTPATVQFRREPAQFLSASNMSSGRWQKLDPAAQQAAMEVCRFENPIFELGPYGGTTLLVPHPRYGADRLELHVTCSPVPGSGCEGQDTDRVSLTVSRYDRSPSWQDGETEELRCRGIHKIRD